MSSSNLLPLRVYLRNYSVMAFRISASDMKVLTNLTCGIQQRGCTIKSPGEGVGKGGGAGGTIREAGGGLGKFAASQEEGYFYMKQKEQLDKIRNKLKKTKEEPEKKDKEEPKDD